MRFSQEQTDDTIIPKVDIFDMSMKNKSKLSKEVGDAIMRESAKITDVAKSATTKKKLPQTFKLIDSDSIDEAFDVTLTLSDNSTKRYELFRFDLADNMSNDEFVMDLDRETLKGMADFIYKYLESN